MRRRLSRRLMLLTFTVVAGFCALATAGVAMLQARVTLYPVFAIAAFAGGFLGARMTSRRSVAEVTIAAVACGLLTALVNLFFADLRIVPTPVARSLGWVASIGATCLVAAIIGGRLGERFSRRPPNKLEIGATFAASGFGLGFGSLLGMYLLYEYAGDVSMAVFQIAALFVIPIAASLLVVVSIEREVTASALLAGAAALMIALLVCVFVAGGELGLALVIAGVPSAWLFFFGWLGKAAFGKMLRRRLPIERPEPEIAAARVR